MNIGTSKLSINPQQPIYLDAYYSERLVESIDDYLYVQVTRFEDSNFKLILISLDIIGITDDFLNNLKSKLTEEIKESELVLYATHTHSGPAILGNRTVDEKYVNYEYLEFVSNQIVDAINQSKVNLTNCSLQLKNVKVSNLYSNRNVKGRDTVDDVAILHFIDSQNKLIGALIQMNCHPTVLDSKLKVLSADLFGKIRTEYENKYGVYPQIMNGNSGDISTRFTRQSKTIAETVRIAMQFLKQIENSDSQFTIIKDSEIKFSKVTQKVNFSPKDDEFISSKITELENEKKINDNKYIDVLLSSLQRKYDMDNISFDNVSFIYDFGGFYLITFAAELVHNLGQSIKDQSLKPVLLCCYANGYHAYLVDQKQYGKYFETFKTDSPKGSADELINKVIAQL